MLKFSEIGLKIFYSFKRKKSEWKNIISDHNLYDIRIAFEFEVNPIWKKNEKNQMYKNKPVHGCVL